MKTAASEVIAAWAEIAALYDPTEGDPVAAALLRNPAAEEEVVSHAISHMGLVDRVEGSLLAQLDYEFCLERQLWRKGIEAILQARALQLILVWAKRFPHQQDALRRIVLRHTFDASFHFATPLLRPHRGFNFVVMPFVYQELLLLPATALSELFPAAQEDEQWAFLMGAGPIDLSSAPAPRAFRKLVARILTSDAFDPNSEEEYAVEVLSRTEGWFRGVNGDHEPGSLETVLGYSAQDFALAHEIGHCLTPVAPGDEGYLQGEVDADIAGFRMFVLSWGWRDEVIEACPLGENARSLLGPIWFFFTVRLLFSLRQGLRERVSGAIECDMEFLGAAKDEEHVNILSRRWDSLHFQLSIYTDSVKKAQGTF